jgi:hypothetical protein
LFSKDSATIVAPRLALPFIIDTNHNGFLFHKSNIRIAKHRNLQNYFQSIQDLLDQRLPFILRQGSCLCFSFACSPKTHLSDKLLAIVTFAAGHGKHLTYEGQSQREVPLLPVSIIQLTIGG